MNLIGFDINTYKNRRKRYCLSCNKELKSGQKSFVVNLVRPYIIIKEEFYQSKQK